MQSYQMSDVVWMTCDVCDDDSNETVAKLGGKHQFSYLSTKKEKTFCASWEVHQKVGCLVWRILKTKERK